MKLFFLRGQHVFSVIAYHEWSFFSCSSPDSGDFLLLNMICDEEEIVTSSPQKNNSSVSDEIVKPSGRMMRTCGAKMSAGGTADFMATSERTLDAEKLSHLRLKAQQRLRDVSLRMESIALTKFERDGLEMILRWLEGLPTMKRGVPKDIPDPEKLLQDIRVSLYLSNYVVVVWW